MRRNVASKLCAIALILIGSAVCRSQDKFETVQHNPDGSIWIRVNGVSYLAITGKQSDDWAAAVKDLEGQKKINVELGIQIKEALLQRDLAQTQRDLQMQRASSFEKDFNTARADAIRNFELFQSERSLRIEASSFVPHGSKTKFDKFLALFDNKYVLSGFKIGLPLIQTWRCQ